MKCLISLSFIDFDMKNDKGRRKRELTGKGWGGGGIYFVPLYTEGLIGEGGLIEDLRYLQIIT